MLLQSQQYYVSDVLRSHVEETGSITYSTDT